MTITDTCEQKRHQDCVYCMSIVLNCIRLYMRVQDSNNILEHLLVCRSRAVDKNSFHKVSTTTLYAAIMFSLHQLVTALKKH